nr:UDP-glucose iridoid glucosyltransferase [Bacopa monnieri]
METSTGQRKRRMVLVPFPIQGHLPVMLQLGSVLQSKGFSIVIVHTDFNSPNPSNHPNDFTFLKLPGDAPGDAASNMLSLMHYVDTNSEGPFRDHMVKMVEEEGVEGEIVCVVYDSLMKKVVQNVASDLKIPTLALRTASAAYNYSQIVTFRLMDENVIPVSESRLHEVIAEEDPLRYKDLPLPANIPALPEIILDPLRNYVDVSSSSALIWNTLDILDHKSLEQLQTLWKVPFFAIGPLHKMASEISPTSVKEEDTADCLSWLDKQAPNSVLYISLGSLAMLETKDLIEMAWGLAKSERPFLWVVRQSLPIGSDALPEDFFETVGKRGLVVKWAPQKKVLAHRSVGGFLTHCGWNSILESLSEGVPMICRPCFSDQFPNSRYVTYVWKVGFELEHGVEGGIERAVRRILDSEEGKEMRQRALHMKQELENSMKCGGSSYESFNKMVEFINSLARKK